ncbi:hypothetical protein KOR42_12410 [Thalassoglobus neptunius]|uniref:Uncharacterized protein n=1 Tax=Thalassoglobus neptunius TaxID=1938619 RepID=A0A5C5X4H3_9PLAN|nr:hypothetical protein [Thalassoglobus neptunius]TWT57874.1 hypothetical protein KOR42_12410 [Thalassoglobus neptunius]
MTGQEHGLPPNTTRRLSDFRQRVRMIKVAEGLLAGIFGLVLSYLAVFALDRIFDTPAIIRGTILVLGSVGLAVFFPLKCHRWLWGTRRMEQVAGLVRHNFPALGDQLLGIVELAQNEKGASDSKTLRQAAIDQVDEVMRDRDLSDAVPEPRHKFWMRTAAIPACLMLLCLIVVPAAGANALGRWLAPWSDIKRFTFAQLDSLPEEMVVPLGEEFPLTATLSSSTQWSPDQGTIHTDALREQVSTKRQEDRYEFTIPPLTSESALNLRIGDARHTIDIHPQPRPELKDIQAFVHLPEYLNYSKPLEIDVRGGVISVVQGSTAEFVATINRELQSARVNGEEAQIQAAQIHRKKFHADSTQTISFDWQDTLGLTAKDDFQLRMNAVEDASPTVGCLLIEPNQVILSTEVINFEISATDDFGLKTLGLEWSGIIDPVRNPHPEQGEKPVLRGDYEQTRLNGTTSFCAETDNVTPQTLQVRAYAEDYRPDGERAYSAPYILHVMTPQDHAIWIANQLRRWASHADDVYEEEVRLHDENRALRRLDGEALQQPATQSRIRRQASAEKANATKLGAVTDAGERLINQAVKNPEMLVGHLELFAETLKQMREMADKRMPSIADLLNESAKSVAKPPSPGAESPSKSAPTAGNNRNQKPGSGEGGAEKKPVPKAPSLSDVEQGFNKPNQAEEEDGKPKPPKNGSTGKLTLPTTTLMGGPKGEKKPQKSEPQEQIDQAVEVQAKLIEDFNKLREQMQDILDDLENSTFVKRFKAASRKQLDIAKNLNRTLFKGFGVEEQNLDDRQSETMELIAEAEVTQSENAWNIQSDLEAYYGRKRDDKLLRILDEMKELETIKSLNQLGNRVRHNLSGESIVHAEFWADTFDRWGEELVSASKCGQCQGGPSDSLPPEIVLEVMRIIEAEMDLREETRSLEQSREAVDVDIYDQRAKKQSETQDTIHRRTLAVMTDIRAIPEGAAKFKKELYLVSMASNAMADATQILGEPNTGPEAIGAETEAIEWLLQSKRANPGGGGGGGGSTPGGGGGGTTSSAALALMGPGHDPNAKVEQREVEQSSGVSVEKLPEEFRDGLDAFFNALEGRTAN